jgi:hypothetical protein
VAPFALIFESPLMAAAVAGGALAIPVVIHLLNRKRFRVVSWAAMRFLLAAQRKNSRRMRLEQLILLAARCLLVLLLVLAMASVTPWAEAFWHWANPGGGLAPAAAGVRTHKIVVLDGSFSMGLKPGDATCFDRARALASKLVRDSVGGDGFSVVLMAAPPKRVVPEPSEDARKVAAEIDALHLSHGNADLAATLATVESLVGASPGKYPQREVYFLTDLQQSTWISRQPQALANTLRKIQTRARSIFVDVGQEGAANVAVTGLSLGDSLAVTGREVPVLATLHNFGPTRHDVSVRLLVGRARTQAGDKSGDLHEVGEVLVPRLEHGQPTPVSFKYSFPRPGDYVLQVQAQHDALELDDQRAAVVTVRDTVPVLLVNGKPATELYDRATEWLRTALKPFEDSERTVVTPKVIGASQLADEGLGDLTPYDCVFLCDVPRFTPSEVRRLEAHLRRGGSVVFALGGRVDLGAYNDALYRDGKGVLPARLVGRQQAVQGWQYQLALDEGADREDPLKPFRNPAARERLLACRFWEFVQAEPAPRAGPRKVLNFAPAAVPLPRGEAAKTSPPSGGPAILEWQPPAAALLAPGAPSQGKTETGRLRGKVVLITTTVNSDWNNWPASPTFPPLMHEILYAAAAARLRERSLEVGEPFEYFLPAGVSVSEAAVRTPDGRTDTARAQPGDDAALRFADTDVSGVYRLTVGQDPAEHLFAVNVPALNEAQQLSESDLTRTNREELQKAYPEWGVQVVTDPAQAVHGPVGTAEEPEAVYRPQGPIVARWLLLGVLVLVLAEVVMAWRFGHYSAGLADDAARSAQARRWPWLVPVVSGVLFAFGLAVAGVLVHDAVTGDFLGFLPERLRRAAEQGLGIPPPAPGEGSRWRLEFSSYLRDGRSDLWLAGTLAAVAAAMIYLVYGQEKAGPAAQSDRVSRWTRAGLRVALLLLLLGVFLPQLKLWFERQGWPDVVILIDDSQSMSHVDAHLDPETQKAADNLTHLAGLKEAQRLQLGQALLTRSQPDWLTALLTQRKVRVHVYHCSTRAHRVADVTETAEVEKGVHSIDALRATESNDSSQLGTAVRQVLNDFRGSSLAAVVMLTDGVTTEGEDLPKVAKYARQVGVPLFFVGIGGAHEARDIYLHDFQAQDSVFVNDTIVFEVRVTVQGYDRASVTVKLGEKGKGKPGEEPVLDQQTVQLDPNTRTAKVRLRHKPTEAGEKVYVVRVDPREDEVDKDNNRLERPVWVHEAKQMKVLYVEGYRRYEYHYLKTLLERESARVRGNKSVDLKVLLLEADPDFPAQDRSAIAEFPGKNELFGYDVVILGDVNPQSPVDPKMNEHLKDLAAFVMDRGGGLLVIAGERYMPHAYRDSPLKDVLPVDVMAGGPETRGDEPIDAGYRPELTAVGRMHPMFRFSPDERENDDIWSHLREMYWYSDGYQPKRAAEVLAVHPKLRRAGGGERPADGSPDRHPLVVQHFIGAGRALFLGFDETWRWGFREDQLRFNQFWIQAVRYLARSRPGRVELRLDRQTPYRRGEPVKVMVRFPEEAQPPDPKAPVKVVVERRGLGRPGARDAGAGETEVRTVQLGKVHPSQSGDGKKDEDRPSRYYETLLTQTPEGEYRFWLSEPGLPDPKPRAEARVLPPPGEMDRLRMNRADLERAALDSGGAFYTLAEADRVIGDLPVGTRVTVNAPGPPYIVWNHFALFALAIGFLTVEWVMRKQKNLL